MRLVEIGRQLTNHSASGAAPSPPRLRRTTRFHSDRIARRIEPPWTSQNTAHKKNSDRFDSIGLPETSHGRELAEESGRHIRRKNAAPHGLLLTAVLPVTPKITPSRNLGRVDRVSCLLDAARVVEELVFVGRLTSLRSFEFRLSPTSGASKRPCRHYYARQGTGKKKQLAVSMPLTTTPK